jgi:amidase
MKHVFRTCAVVALSASASATAIAAPYSVVDKPASAIAADLAAHRVTAAELVKAYEARIAKLNPKIHAVIALNPNAIAEARASDARRAAGTTRGPLDGVPVLIKDNTGIAGLPVTAGSLALAKNVRKKSATVVARLMKAGAVILARANLSEWANMRSTHSTSGWTAIGGLTRNPYVLARTACGSSSGSAAGVAASLAAASIGTETDGSVTCPAATNGQVGLKPTVGLVSRAGIIPASHTQDTAGPITHTVRDAAMMLTAMAGSDKADPVTAGADAHRADYMKALDPHALKGVRLGVEQFLLHRYTPQTLAAFNRALAALRAQGATIVEVRDYDMGPINKNENLVLLTDMKTDLNKYLAGSPPAVKTRTLAGLIAFNKAHPGEMRWFGQELFVMAEKTKGLHDPAYLKARATNLRLAGPDGIDRLLKEHKIAALISPTRSPASVIDIVNGGSGHGANSGLPAIAGYPYITVPMGMIEGLPVGISFIGPKWSEARLLGFAYAYEQATHAARPPKFMKRVSAQ